MTKKTVDYKKLYNLTGDVTPLQGDCGNLCRSICCQPDKENTLGMYLFPGEEVMFTGKEDWLRWERRHPVEDEFPPSWSYPVYFVRCTKPCPREKRPLSCRLFPLAPHLLGDDTLLLIYETLPLPYSCPLITEKIPLRKDFIKAVAQCWQELLKDQRIYDLVKMDSKEREQEDHRPYIVWEGTIKKIKAVDAD
ncbi:hypothetical protein JOC37_002060 [Desulfohalotomaculum tongense]|uniref:hypothetical protein n=1 Tax=Desulforadius tongensis TaxID=1216062 RepID=UPI00195E4BBA|nr:hypothetical protein [Desulforadius tongensis]MBM7855655.1 hypothetical protein [Desulforadius tongensis]